MKPKNKITNKNIQHYFCVSYGDEYDLDTRINYYPDTELEALFVYFHFIRQKYNFVSIYLEKWDIKKDKLLNKRLLAFHNRPLVKIVGL